jgi:hypothetical protein
MRGKQLLVFGVYGALSVAWACSSTPTGFNFANDGGSSGSGGSGGSGGGSGSGSGSGPEFDGGNLINGDGGNGAPPGQEASVTVNTTMYADTETELWSVDPKTNQATLIGSFAFPGVADASGAEYTITDIAVNAAGDIYVNSESYIYKVTLPSGGTGTINLTGGVAIQAAAGSNGAYFYALAFVPAGALGAGTPEFLIGGDGSGNLWSIDPTTGASVNLGNFGNDPTTSGNFMALSGDIVFYQVANADGGTSFQGLATIRSCTPNATHPTYAPTCVKTNDYLAAVDMGALATAYSTNTPAKSLNAGIYGGSATTLGNGIGHGEMFGLAAVGSDVVGFAKYQSGATSSSGGGTPIPASTWTIDTTPTSGAGTQLPQTFSFTDGWAGAAVTTTVTINVPPPPPPPPAPK